MDEISASLWLTILKMHFGNEVREANFDAMKAKCVELYPGLRREGELLRLVDRISGEGMDGLNERWGNWRWER